MTVRWTPMGWDDPIVLPLIGGQRERGREREPDDLRVEHPEVLTEQEDAVAYLTVCGNGTWGYAHPETLRMVDFAAGLHRVDATTVAFARRSGIPLLVVTDERPVVVRRLSDWFVRPEHVRVPARGTDVGEDGDHVLESDLVLERPLAYACTHCGARYPHPAPLRRHVLRAHAAELRRTRAAPPKRSRPSQR